MKSQEETVFLKPDVVKFFRARSKFNRFDFLQHRRNFDELRCQIELQRRVFSRQLVLRQRRDFSDRQWILSMSRRTTMIWRRIRIDGFVSRYFGRVCSFKTIVHRNKNWISVYAGYPIVSRQRCIRSWCLGINIDLKRFRLSWN